MSVIKIIKDELNTILENTKDTALSDGKITEEEAHLIDILHENISGLEDELLMVASGLDKDLEETEIRSRVKMVSRDIFPKLSDAAKNDGVVSEDEAAILSRVLDSIMN